MTRGRKPTAGTEIVPIEINEEAVAQDAQAMTMLEVGQQMVMDAAGVLKQVGRIEAMQFSATVAERVIAETYTQIKESKAYKGLPYRDADGKARQVASLEEFCEIFMPRSHRRCQELAANLHLLGPELYEQAEAIGFRQRDYNALKALPGDDQAIVKQAIEAGKFENAIDLMQDMAVRHAKEREALQAELNATQETLQIRDNQLEGKDRKINDLDAQLSQRAQDPEYAEKQALADLDRQALEAASKVHASLRAACIGVLGERSIHGVSRTARQAIAAALGRVRLAVDDLADDLGIAPNDTLEQAADEADEIWAHVNAEMAAREQAAGKAGGND